MSASQSCIYEISIFSNRLACKWYAIKENKEHIVCIDNKNQNENRSGQDSTHWFASRIDRSVDQTACRLNDWLDRAHWSYQPKWTTDTAYLLKIIYKYTHIRRENWHVFVILKHALPNHHHLTYYWQESIKAKVKLAYMCICSYCHYY